jgi:hypothetical protein
MCPAIIPCHAEAMKRDGLMPAYPAVGRPVAPLSTLKNAAVSLVDTNWVGGLIPAIGHRFTDFQRA